MKTLYESLLDDEGDLLNDNSILIDNFLKSYYKIFGTYTIHNNIVDVKGEIEANPIRRRKLFNLTNDLFEFGTIDGNFSCINCFNIQSLKNSPKIVKGNFNCSGANIKTLKDGPQMVDWNYICMDCNNLKTLDGVPEKIPGIFCCTGCADLSTLEGGPKETGCFIAADCKKLKNLKGMPDIVRGYADFSGCINLESLEGKSKSISGDLFLTNCKKIKNIK